VPLYSFILDGVAQDPALNQGDGIHPNPRGAQIVADKLLPFVIQNLDNAAVHRPSRP
jgi:acyl-CoA thioesterase-1